MKTSEVTDPNFQAALKSIVNNSLDSTVSRHLLDSYIRNSLLEVLCQDISAEARFLCSKSETGLQGADPVSLKQFSWTYVERILRKCSPMLLLILEAAANIKAPTEKGTARVAFAACVLLFHRNPHVSLVQHVLGLLLDHGGATDEVIMVI